MTEATEIHYSLSELKDLVERSDSCVTVQRKPRILYLNPVQFSNIKSGIHDSLNSLLFKYDFFFKGIVLGYRKIKLLTRYGAFCYRSSKVSLQIEADFYLFNPEVGSKLKGVVCKRSGHHLSVLVHKAFTVFLPLNENNYETGWDYAIGQDIEFEVVSMDLTSGPLPYIKGKLIVEEKEGDKGEDEGTSVATGGVGNYGNGCLGSDSGVASSPGRESEDSDDSDRDDVSVGSSKKSTIEDQMYKTHRKPKDSLSDVLMKEIEREAASDDESGVYSSKSQGKSDNFATGETSSQEMLSPPTEPKRRKSILKKKKLEPLSEDDCSTKSLEAGNTSFNRVTSSQESSSDIPLSPPVPKKRKSILKKHKDVSCVSEIDNNFDVETFNTSVLIKSQESASDAASTSHSPKKRKSILKTPKETKIFSEDDKSEGSKEKLETTDKAEGNKSPVKRSPAKGVSEIDDKSISILKNIVGDLSPKKYGMGSVKSILETLKKSESEKSFSEDGIDLPKSIPMPKKRMSVVKTREVISSSDDEDVRESETRTLKPETSNLERLESKAATTGDGKSRKENDSDSEKNGDSSKVGKMREDVEESDNSSSKKKRKSLSKSNKRASMLYESLAEKIQEVSGVTSEENLGTHLGHPNVSISDPKNVGDGSCSTSLKKAKETSTGSAKKKTPIKKEHSSSGKEDLVKQLLKKMEMAIDEEVEDDPANISEKITAESSAIKEETVVSESKNQNENLNADLPKKAAAKRKSLSNKKPSLVVEDMIKRLEGTTKSPEATNDTSSPKEETDEHLKEAKPNENLEILKRQSLGGGSKDGSKKKSRKSVANVIPISEEAENLGTLESLKSDKTSSSATPAMGGSGNESKSTNVSGSAESGIDVKIKKKQRQSVGEKKSKTKKPEVNEDVPQAVKEETDIQIEKLLMMNKKMLGLDNEDESEDQWNKVSTEEKKSKKRKRESSGMKDSPKKRKAIEVASAAIPNA